MQYSKGKHRRVYFMVLYLIQGGCQMKISKIQNTRTGIGLKDGNNMGILYENPKKPDAKKEIKSHIKEANERAKSLYSPFTSISVVQKVQEYKKQKWEYKNSEKEVKDAGKKVVKNIAEQKEFSLTKIEEAIIEANNYVNVAQNVDELFCDNIVKCCLRKSLKKSVKTEEETIYIPNVINKLLKVIVGLKNFNELTESELHAFYKVVYEDYSKTKQIEKLVKSIENKDTKVQVMEINGEKRLELSNASNEKKKYISDFVNLYAGFDAQTQQELLIHQRMIILLYVCGVKKYKQAKNVDLMQKDWGGLLPDDNENISDALYESICSNGKNHSLRHYDKMRMEHYGQAIRVEGISKEDIQWIGYYNEELGKVFKKKSNRDNPVKIGSKYLINYLWKRWTSFIAGKYIALGKAVYHFAMPDLRSVEQGKAVAFGKVLECYQDGITSFDYERIKAKESLARDLAVYVTFAANTFARATVEPSYMEKNGNEDVLSYKEDSLNEALKNSADRRILQYFGGKSKWENTDIAQVDEKKLFIAIKDEINAVRNANYHYITNHLEELKDSNEIVKMLYNKEYTNIGYSLRKKYYSNNILMFYSKENINTFMDRLYEKPVKREAQIPSFGNIFKKTDCKTLINQKITGDIRSRLYEGMEKFYGAFYFIAKEIYYYDFLQLPDIKDRFEKALEQVNEKKEDNKNARKEAKQDFKKYLKKYCKGKTFGETCQCIMTEYNQQNQQFKEVRTREEKEINKEIYQHFRMLLYVTLKEAFCSYLTERAEYQFLLKPKYEPEIHEKIKEVDFCENYSVGIFRDIKSMDKQAMFSWYITAHFITTKQLNHLQGAIKDYLQYIKDIERRAESTCNRVADYVAQEEEYYTGILKVLSVVMTNAGQVSNVFEDYFESQEEYAEHIGKYVAYSSKEQSLALLKAFCNTEIDISDKQDSKSKKKPTGNALADIISIYHGEEQKKKTPCKDKCKIGIYYDELNPIPNRNVIYSAMYGFEKQVSNVFTVKEKDIKEYYKLSQELADVFKQGKCRTEEQQRQLRKYQDIKNKVELHDVTTYTELLIDCIAQLVSYTYLRERDLMYMQLGFAYLQLRKNGDKDCKENRLYGTDFNITGGAILYQIAAMYSHEAPMIVWDKDNYQLGKKGSVGAKIGSFVKCYSREKYFAGLYFFENISLHDEYSTNRRNYIAHMKYLSKGDKSILEMFSWMYNGFFDYDIKLKKSVSYIMRNIMMRYFLILNTKMELVKNTYNVPQKPIIADKPMKNITLSEVEFGIKSIDSENFVYKEFELADKRKSLEIPARSKEFCNNVKALLLQKN